MKIDELERIKREKLKKWMERMKGSDIIQTEIEVNDENFQEKVIEQSKKIPVVVDFWASWCMPCLMLSPILEKLAKEYNGKFILAKLNVDENRITSQKYGIMSIPSVKLFKNGKVVDEFVGALPELSVREWLNKSIRGD
jgi:putative thioredoxin